MREQSRQRAVETLYLKKATMGIMPATYSKLCTVFASTKLSSNALCADMAVVISLWAVRHE